MAMLQKKVLPLVLLLMILPLACSAGQSGQTQANTGGRTEASENASLAQGQAAELAAQTQLRNVQTDENEYFSTHQAYAPSAAALRELDPHINPKVNIVKGGADNFEINIEADDSQKTVYIIRKTGDLIERVDSNGHPW